MKGRFIGLDVGGTKIASATLQDGKLETRELIKTDVSDSDKLVAQLVELIGHLRTDDTVAAGVGLPSIIEFETGRIAHSVNIPLADLPLRELLSDKAGIPVYIENDASCAALAEAFDTEGNLVVPEPRDAHRRHRRRRRPRLQRPPLPRRHERRRDRPHGDRARPRGRRAHARGQAPAAGHARVPRGRPRARPARRARGARGGGLVPRQAARAGRRGHRPRRGRRRQGGRRRRAARARHPRPAARHRDRQRDQPVRPAGDRHRRRRLDRRRPAARPRERAWPRSTRCPASASTRRSGSRATARRPACSARRWSPPTRKRRSSRMATARELETDYLPIAEHGLVGDLHTIALVGTNGTIDWYCCPSFDAPSVFGAILDKEQGRLLRAAPDRRGLGREAALLPGDERPHHALLHRGRRRRGAGLHADRPRRDRGAPPPADPARGRRARPHGVPARGAAALRLRPRRARGRDAPARGAVPLARPDARARGRDRAHDGPRAAARAPRRRHLRARLAAGRRVAVVPARARRPGPHLPPALGARGGQLVRGDGHATGASGSASRATAAAGARW